MNWKRVLVACGQLVVYAVGFVNAALAGVYQGAAVAGTLFLLVVAALVYG